MHLRFLSRPLVAGIGGVAALSLVLACAGVPGTAAAPVSPSIPAATVARGDIQQTLSLTGDVRAKDQITVLPKASGRVEQMLVDVGTPVHAGDTIAQLESESPEIAVSQAQANLAAAQAKLSTVQAGGTADDVTAAQEAVAQQEAKLASMQAEGRAEDVAAAQAALAAQQAKLDLLQAGGRPRRSPRPRPASTPRSRNWRWCSRVPPTTCARQPSAR